MKKVAHKDTVFFTKNVCLACAFSHRSRLVLARKMAKNACKNVIKSGDHKICLKATL